MSGVPSLARRCSEVIRDVFGIVEPARIAMEVPILEGLSGVEAQTRRLCGHEQDFLVNNRGDGTDTYGDSVDGREPARAHNR